MTNNALVWRPTNAPAAKRYDDIWFVTPDVGWAVNSSGHILHTTDGGLSWTEQFHVTADENADVWLRCLGFANPSRGWAGTTSGEHRLYETKDGGNTWTPVTNLPPDAPDAVCGLSVVNESVVYASGTNYPYPKSGPPPRMMKTIDGGLSWQAWDMTEHASLLVDTYFTSPQNGWVVGGKAQPVTPGQKQCTKRPDRADIKPVVLATTDGGETWTNRVADIEDQFWLGEWGWKIFFLNDRIGFVSLESFCGGAILKTEDGGHSWKRIPINDPKHNANLEGLGFVDADHGWVGGWGSASMLAGSSSETRDGGQTWSDIDWGKPNTGEFLNRFRFFGHPVTLGYASGDTVYKYSANISRPATQAVTAPQSVLFDNAEPAETRRPLRVQVSVPHASRFSINIFDRFGAHIRRLAHEKTPSRGQRIVEWDVQDDQGQPLQPGYYIVRATADHHSESKIIWVTD